VLRNAVQDAHAKETWMGKMWDRAFGLIVSATVLTTFGAAAADAQSVEAFYHGKTIDMVIGYPPGGSNDFYARAVARHIGKHIPGKPSVLPKNMPGGGSLVAANWLSNIAPKDGTVLGLIAATIPLEARLGAQNVKFKASKFNWIGRVAAGVNMTFVWHTVPVKTIQDTMKREVLLGASARTSTVAIYPSVLSNVIGTKFKLVMGYKSSTTAMLAMERGEVEGHSTSLQIVESLHSDWIKDKKIKILVQYALKRHPDLPDIPLSWELGRTPEEKQILRIVANATEVGKMILSPPGLPADRVTALRRAFDETVKDPEFLADLKKLHLEVGAMSGGELQELVEEVDQVPPATMDKVKAIYPLN
jgi:tripartite-type tricarboxylate transporter receptor subunit TctC